MVLWDSSGRGLARAEGVYSNSCFEPFPPTMLLSLSLSWVVLAIRNMTPKPILVISFGQ